MRDPKRVVNRDMISMFTKGVGDDGHAIRDPKNETKAQRNARVKAARKRLRLRRAYSDWIRNGQKGRRPPMQETVLEGDESTEDILENPDLQRAHIAKYGLWLLKHLEIRQLLYTQPDGWSPPASFALLFRFDVSEDVALQHPKVCRGGLHLDVMLVLHERRVHMIETSYFEGFHAALEAGALEIQCTPDNCLLVLQDGMPPEGAFRVTVTDPSTIVF